MFVEIYYVCFTTTIPGQVSVSVERKHLSSSNPHHLGKYPPHASVYNFGVLCVITQLQVKKKHPQVLKMYIGTVDTDSSQIRLTLVHHITSMPLQSREYACLHTQYGDVLPFLKPSLCAKHNYLWCIRPKQMTMWVFNNIGSSNSDLHKNKTPQRFPQEKERRLNDSLNLREGLAQG